MLPWTVVFCLWGVLLVALEVFFKICSKLAVL